jgi:hypothetical protein
MKLAEALVLRADLNTRIDQLNERIQRCVLVQEGEHPLEDAHLLLIELDKILDQLRDLITRINLTNLRTVVQPQHLSLTAAIAQRDIMGRQHGLLMSIVKAASERFTRYSRSEIRILPTIDIGALHHKIDDIARQRREIDTAIQSANWETELVE